MKVAMAVVLLIAIGLPGILMGLYLAPWFFFLLLLMMFVPLLFLRPTRK